MKPVLDRIGVLRTAANASLRSPSVLIGYEGPDALRYPTTRTRLQSPPQRDRGRSSVRAHSSAAPASGLDDVSSKDFSLLQEANREWFFWRFGEDS